MTTNAFIFSWDIHGIESIVPISKYEHHDKQNLINILSEKSTTSNPMNAILHNLMLRARYNTHRHYEIYAVDCTEEMDEEFWKKQWNDYPQDTADLIRERGHKLYSDRATRNQLIK
jgi:hypothetical protein